MTQGTEDTRLSCMEPCEGEVEFVTEPRIQLQVYQHTAHSQCSALGSPKYRSAGCLL